MRAAIEAKELLLKSGLANSANLLGCSAEEVAAVETAFGHALPESYKQFLFVMGKEAGDFMVGTDLFYEYLPGQRECAKELLAEAKAQYALKATDFVFCSHQGYQFLFFDAAESPDPAVYHYMELDPAPKRRSDSFSAWLTGAVKNHCARARAKR